MRPIEQVIEDVENFKEKPLPSAVGFEVIMYLEMLHDLMSMSMCSARWQHLAIMVSSVHQDISSR